jgi:hypothetical protein
VGVEVEPFCGRRSPQAKSRAQPRELRRTPTLIRITMQHQGVLSRNCAGPPRESPAGFRIASPLHNKKKTPGEDAGCRDWSLLRCTLFHRCPQWFGIAPAPTGATLLSPPLKASECEAEKGGQTKKKSPSLRRRPARSAAERIRLQDTGISDSLRW